VGSRWIGAEDVIMLLRPGSGPRRAPNVISQAGAFQRFRVAEGAIPDCSTDRLQSPKTLSKERPTENRTHTQQTRGLVLVIITYTYLLARDRL